MLEPTARVIALYIGIEKRKSMIRVPTMPVIAGEGIVGDRYRKRSNAPERQITLISVEAIDALNEECGIPFDPAESRRNLLTENVLLNDLVGREFRVGDVRLRGIMLCDPCGHLQKLTRPGVLKGLENRGGLRAEILVNGLIHVGDPVLVD